MVGPETFRCWLRFFASGRPGLGSCWRAGPAAWPGFVRDRGWSADGVGFVLGGASPGSLGSSGMRVSPPSWGRPEGSRWLRLGKEMGDEGPLGSSFPESTWGRSVDAILGNSVVYVDSMEEEGPVRVVPDHGETGPSHAAFAPGFEVGPGFGRGSGDRGSGRGRPEIARPWAIKRVVTRTCDRNPTGSAPSPAPRPRAD